MTKPVLIMDQHFRRVEELFDDATLARLKSICDVVGAQNHPMEKEAVQDHMATADILVAARPHVSAADIAGAPNLKAVIEVSGAFHGEIDYAACLDRGVEVLSCSPGFRRAVAEMGLAMILAGGRGLIAEHEAFRRGTERWLDDRDESDFTLFHQSIGFVGYGNIARELHRLIAPFSPKVSFYDPWVDATLDAAKAETLDAIFAKNRIVVVTATPTSENRHAIGEAEVAAMQDGSLLVLLGRAHVMDFDPVLAEAKTGRITFATDVFPSEPVPSDHPLRLQPNVILSPHRAAAVPGGRHLIGEMILHDIEAMQAGRTERMLQAVDPARVAALVAAQEAIEADGRLPNT